MASEPAFYKNHRRFTAIALIAALGLIPLEAYGYIDPGTGSQLLQIIAAGLLTALFFIKTIWRVIVGWITKWFKPKSDASTENPDKKDTDSDE